MSIIPTSPSAMREVRKLIEQNQAAGDWGEPMLPGREFVSAEEAKLIEETDEDED